MTLTVNLHFRSLSTGEPHSKASKSTVELFKDRAIVLAPSALIEIVGDYIAILLIFPTAPDKLYLVDWSKGEVYPVRVREPASLS